MLENGYFFIKMNIILIIGIIFIIFFCVFLTKKWIKFFEKKNMVNKINSLKKVNTIITSRDIRAIAGEDVITTQLDLARAYIELGKEKLAKKILDHVIQHGDSHQQESAQQLLTKL